MFGATQAGGFTNPAHRFVDPRNGLETFTAETAHTAKTTHLHLKLPNLKPQ